MTEIPTADWTWINAAADRFERARKDGLRPKIEDCVAEAEESRRPRLLEELFRVELETRHRAGGCRWQRSTAALITPGPLRFFMQIAHT
jgi:hypothetical protein